MKKPTHHDSCKGTHTAAGFVPHLQFMGLSLPVKLDIDRHDLKALAFPTRHGEYYVYMLPGGSEYLP